MYRVDLSHESLNLYFENVTTASKKTNKDLSNILGISERTLSDWHRGKFRFPLVIAKYIEKNFGVHLPKDAHIESEKKFKTIAGKKGAIVRNVMYGNPGTLEGRRKGGLNSLATHVKQKTGFKLLKKIKCVQKSENHAEFIGVMIGDGGMTQNQIRVTLGLDEKEYSESMSKMIRVIFGWNPSFSTRDKNGTIELVLSGRALVQELNGLGLPMGNKIKQGVRIPDWIMKNKLFVIAGLRGIFDTDGSVYLDTHYTNLGSYSSICIAYTSYSSKLLSDIWESLHMLDFHPTSSTKNRIMIRRKEEVKKFFDVVAPRNVKHLERFAKFIQIN